MSIPHSEFHEVWWIYSPVNGAEWAGLRIAHFRKAAGGELLAIIQGETDPRRIGMRVWGDIQRTEFWYRVKQIAIPSLAEVFARAIDIEDLDGFSKMLEEKLP